MSTARAPGLPCTMLILLVAMAGMPAAEAAPAPPAPGDAPVEEPAPSPKPPGNAKAPVKNPIPDDRCIAWKPGIPGGIPKYPLFASVKDPAYGAKGDGKADDTAAIQKA